MRDLVLVDPRAQRARLFRDAINAYRRRMSLLRERAEQAQGVSLEQRTRALRLMDTLNSVAARRSESLNGDDIRLSVFATPPPAIDYLRELVAADRRAVVFTDVYLRGTAVSGADFVAHMKRDRELRLVPTVLLATDAPPYRVREAWQAGSSAVVHLPIELPGMLLRVTDAVEFWFATARL